MAIHRRAFMAMSALALAGCAGAIHGDNDPPRVVGRRTGPSRFRIAIFEIDGLNFPFHTGLIIHAPNGRYIYDPAGYWDDEHATRVDDLWYNITPQMEDAYLRREAPGITTNIWRLHLFETEVPDSVANRAVAVAASRPSALFGACSLSLSSLLQGLPGFEEIEASLLPGSLLEQLQARNDLRYSFRASPNDLEGMGDTAQGMG